MMAKKPHDVEEKRTFKEALLGVNPKELDQRKIIRMKRERSNSSHDRFNLNYS